MKNTLRRVVIETLPSLLAPAKWPIAGEEYCLVVIADLGRVPADLQQLGDFAASAVRSGPRLVISYGSAAELIHDVFDEVIVMQHVAGNQSLKPEENVLTISLGEDPLSDVLEEIFEVYTLPGSTGPSSAPIVFVVLEGDHRIAEISAFLESRSRVQPAVLPR